MAGPAEVYQAATEGLTVVVARQGEVQSEYAHARPSEFSIDAGKITITGPHLHRPLQCNRQLPC
jgi:hypothetical protein